VGVVSAAKTDVRDVLRKPIWYFVFGVLFAAFLFPMVKSYILVPLKSKGVPVPNSLVS
jgi:hypothetical protein